MPHLIYLAIGFPPAAKSSTYRLRATANLMAERDWDVTVITIEDDAWHLESGLDHSLLHDVDQRIEIVKLPLRRPELDPDILRMNWLRARHPKLYLNLHYARNEVVFPESVFGRWRRALEDAVLKIHHRKPADLMLVSVTPYTGLAAAWRLWKEEGIPYGIDYRDGWSIDVIDGGEAFPRWSRRGRWEAKVVGSAQRLWFVNNRIREFYAARYPGCAGRTRVVRNGWDPFPTTPKFEPSNRQFTFGYLGTAIFPLDYTAAMLAGWRLARSRDDFVASSRLVFRGHFGLVASGLSNGHSRRIAGYAVDDVHFEGPVPKAQVANLYQSWDALVFAITGGPYMTSGKIYEYMATGLPIMSVHRPDHGASEVLDGYPLWIPPPIELTAESLAESFINTGKLVRESAEGLRDRAREHAAQFTRQVVMSEAIDDLLGSVRA